MGIKTIRFLLQHPLSRKRKFFAFKRFLTWQIGSRLIGMPVAADFVQGSRLLIYRGMTGATGNLYAGLHEFEDMAFALHALRREDLFVDVGANIGSYTILAGACAGSSCIAIEPVPSTFKHLVDNVNLNGIISQVECLNIGIGKEKGALKFSFGEDTTNHVLSEQEDRGSAVKVNVEKLDDLLHTRQALVIKIDVEGWESQVISGACKTFSDSNPIAVIMEFGLGARYGFDEKSIHRKMLEFGFDTYKYEPFQRKLVSLERSNKATGNTIYIKGIKHFSERLKSSPKYKVFGTEL